MQKFGLARDYWLETGSESVDPGLYAATKKEEDRYRLPATQLGQTMDAPTAADIGAFLESLTGAQPPGFAPPGY